MFWVRSCCYTHIECKWWCFESKRQRLYYQFNLIIVISFLFKIFKKILSGEVFPLMALLESYSKKNIFEKYFIRLLYYFNYLYAYLLK